MTSADPNIGSVHGKWTVLEVGLRYRGLNACRVRCACGYERILVRYELLAGDSKMCRTCSKTTHGGTYSAEYMIWRAMLTRVYNPKSPAYPSYGGRGVEVHPSWRSTKRGVGFANFIRDVGARPDISATLDRIDNNGNYEPANVRWTTRTVQANNTRSNIRITAFGETHTLHEWASLKKLNPRTIAQRIDNGWAVELALTQPPRAIALDYEERSRNIKRKRYMKSKTASGIGSGGLSDAEVEAVENAAADAAAVGEQLRVSIGGMSMDD